MLVGGVEYLDVDAELFPDGSVHDATLARLNYGWRTSTQSGIINSGSSGCIRPPSSSPPNQSLHLTWPDIVSGPS